MPGAKFKPKKPKVGLKFSQHSTILAPLSKRKSQFKHSVLFISKMCATNNQSESVRRLRWITRILSKENVSNVVSLLINPQMTPDRGFKRQHNGKWVLTPVLMHHSKLNKSALKSVRILPEWSWDLTKSNQASLFFLFETCLDGVIMFNIPIKAMSCKEKPTLHYYINMI